MNQVVDRAILGNRPISWIALHPLIGLFEQKSNEYAVTPIDFNFVQVSELSLRQTRVSSANTVELSGICASMVKAGLPRLPLCAAENIPLPWIVDEALNRIVQNCISISLEGMTNGANDERSVLTRYLSRRRRGGQQPSCDQQC